MSDTARRSRPVGIAVPVIACVLVYLVGVLVVPLLALCATVLSNLPEVVGQLTTPEALHAMGLSLVLAAIALGINLVAGIAGAIVLVRQQFYGRSLLDALVEMPLALSPVMVGLGFFLLFGRTGWARPVIDALGLKVTFAFPGLVLATTFVTLPFIVREVGLILKVQGTSEEQAAATLGASPWQTFWLVTIPNIRQGLELGATLTVARALGEFGAVLVLGGAISGETQTATTFIHASMEERQEPAAYGMAMLLAAAAAGLLAFLQSRRRR